MSHPPQIRPVVVENVPVNQSVFDMVHYQEDVRPRVPHERLSDETVSRANSILDFVLDVSTVA